MKYSALIFNYGSIGSKHARILKKYLKLNEIYIYTKKKIKNYAVINSLNDIKKKNIDYFIIASPTTKHFRYLNFLENNFKNKKILIEKPLFHKFINYKIIQNKVYVGYNLRFNKMLNFIKFFIKNRKIIDIKVQCSSFLPSWRKGKKYQNTNSALKSLGGGVTLELSHEIDYIRWIFGNFQIKFVEKGKFSNLKIDTEDLLRVFGKINKANLLIDLNFYSRINQRKLYIDGIDFSIIADLLLGKLIINNKGKEKVKYFKGDKDETYLMQHKKILQQKGYDVCSYKFGLETMKVLDKIKKWKKN